MISAGATAGLIVPPWYFTDWPTIEMIGTKKIASPNRTETTRLDSPVRAPSLTPAPLST